jgi:hypothetical protein
MADQGVEGASEATQGRPANEDAIKRRAYEISQSESAGTPEENWQRAERELGESTTTKPDDG